METGIVGCKPVETPMEANLKLEGASSDKVVNLERFQKLVGGLIYHWHTKPDIAFAFSVVVQIMHSPGEHFEAVYRILKYLKGKPRSGLQFENHGHLRVVAYQMLAMQEM